MMAGRRSWAYESGLLWGLDEGIRPTYVTSRVPTVFAEIGMEHVDELAQAMGLPSSDVIVQRLAAGKRCFAGWVDGALATYGWASQGAEQIGELERHLRMAPGEAYIWECATLEAYRGKRLYSALLLCIVETLRNEGVGRIWIGSSAANQPSLRGFVNIGFQPVLSVIYIRLLKLSCFFMSSPTGAPKALVGAARSAVLRPDERTIGPLALAWN